MSYIWQQKDWPNFIRSSELITKNAYSYGLKASAVVGNIEQISAEDSLEESLELMLEEALNSSQIEGEIIAPEDIRSSLRNQLGLNARPERVRDRRAHGIAALMISVRRHFKEPLSEKLLHEWHSLLFSRRRLNPRFEVGTWRATAEPMYIISGEMGREKIHYEAPPSHVVPAEMTKFITWFNASSDLPGALRAGLAHLYFECIHPFADGNGRIGRAVAEMALSQELGKPVMLSLSTTIASRRKEYYAALAQASNGGLDSLLNARQTLVLHRMLREGSRGFAGGINAGKYTKIAACSKATATRDLSDLFDKSCLKKCAGGGRSTRYEISFDD